MRSIRNAIQNSYAASRSMAVRLVLYWFIMALLLVAAILSILMATGVLSHPARQLASALDIQQKNTYAALDAQMDELTAHSVAISEKLGRELDTFLAAKGIPFDALNDDPATIAELEKRLYAPLSSTLSAASCSGIFFCLNVTANTELPNADVLRAGLYLRYTGLQPTVASEQDAVCFRGAAEAARGLRLQMHNRWNPELNTALIPGSERVSASQVERPAEGSLWVKRTELLDTWEYVTLLCVPILDGSGTARGFCGMEISDLYFSLSHDTVSSAYLDSEVLNLFEVIKGHKIELVVLLTAFYGLRRSEVIGLKWSAFDFNHDCFSIRHTVTTCNVKGERVTIKKDKAKNKSSLRTYPLIPFLKERLLEAKKQQEENRKLCGRSYNKEYLGYVCVDVIGNLIKPNYVSSTFGKLLAKNNLRHIRFHDLRHTCASLLLANGVPMEQVKEWLGHSEISTTVDIYGHLQYATKKQSAAAIEQDIVAPMLQNLSAVSP